MKRSLLSAAVLSIIFSVRAQNYENIKNLVMLTQYAKAKGELDRSITDAKFTAKPETYILKATIYSALANEPDKKGTAEGDQLTAEAETAFKKYREMDPSGALITDPLYQNAPINIYSALYTSGYNDYVNKNWQAGFQKLKKVVEYADLLIAKKIIAIPADTNTLILAGITAENAGLKDEAAKYYRRLADLKVGSKDFESVYRYVVNYYVVKKDFVNFEKYKAIGKELYPGSEYFNYDRVDFTVGVETDFNKKIKALDELLAVDPTNYKAAEVLGEIIYDTLNPRNEAAPPANAAQLETKMVNAFNKSAALSPGNELPFLYIGNHYINKSVKINAAREKDPTKKAALDIQYNTSLEAAREPYEKAAAIFVKKGSLTTQDKQQYRNLAGYLADIYATKKFKAKGNAADQAKYAAEEKKWEEVYDSMK